MNQRFLIAISLAVIALAPRLQAHPTAATEITITLAADRRVDVAIVTDAAPLDAKLAALGGTLTDHVTLTFDDRVAPLTAAARTPVEGAPGRIRLSLTAPVPADTFALTFRTSLVFGSYPLAVQREGAAAAALVEWLNGAATSRPIALAGLPEPIGGWAMVWQGFTHILPHGLDHILFVTGLFLLARRTRDVLVQITTFTVAHSVTLGLAMAGLVSIPASIVEPLIALSIVYVAVENLLARALTTSRLVLIFAFGLLHGLGFAEALAGLGVSTGQMLSSLVAFNAGVEAGQLTVIAIAATLVAAMRVPAPDYRRLVTRPASIVIALAGAFWTVERML
jgi:HupE / UreJ protein